MKAILCVARKCKIHYPSKKKKVRKSQKVTLKKLEKE